MGVRTEPLFDGLHALWMIKHTGERGDVGGRTNRKVEEKKKQHLRTMNSVV